METYELECVLLCASRLSILSKDASPREPTRVGDLPPVTPVAASPAAATPTKTPPTPTKTGVPPAAAPNAPSAPRRRPAAPTTTTTTRRTRQEIRESTAYELAAHLRGFFAARLDSTDALAELDDAVAAFLEDAATTRRTRAVPTVHRPSTNPRDYPRRELSRTPATVAP